MTLERARPHTEYMTTTAIVTLATATPVEIDTALAEIYTRFYAVQGKIVQHRKFIEDMKQGIAKHATGKFGGMYSGYTQSRLDLLNDEYLDLEIAASEIYQETFPYENEFSSRPWTRFFLVKNNGGHIHSSMNCSTCFDTTQFGWLPEISGLTEAEAVAKHGAILCTVCYPTAPTEWTNGTKPGDENVCEGSGSYYDSSLPHRTGYYTGNWGTCSGCGTAQTVSKGGKIRKHKI